MSYLVQERRPLAQRYTVWDTCTPQSVWGFSPSSTPDAESCQCSTWQAAGNGPSTQGPCCSQGPRMKCHAPGCSLAQSQVLQTAAEGASIQICLSLPDFKANKPLVKKREKISNILLICSLLQYLNVFKSICRYKICSYIMPINSFIFLNCRLNPNMINP